MKAIWIALAGFSAGAAAAMSWCDFHSDGLAVGFGTWVGLGVVGSLHALTQRGDQ